MFYAKILGTFAVLFLLVAGGVIFFFYRTPEPEPVKQEVVVPKAVREVIGHSVEGREIEAYTYGNGSTHLVFVGGIHGGYEWNSVLVAYQLKDYLDANPAAIASSERVTIIPNANPDGVFNVVKKEGRFSISDVPVGDASAGRFNANKVDLNRNFDCDWAPTGTWQNKTVSAGTKVFSEPEAVAIRDYASANKSAVFVFWHSAAGGVYASQCGKGILPITLDMMNAYAGASKYAAVKTFDAYVVHGASEDWLASIGVPAITVELSSHNDLEWDRNLDGVKALLTHFASSTP